MIATFNGPFFNAADQKSAVHLRGGILTKINKFFHFVFASHNYPELADLVL